MRVEGVLIQTSSVVLDATGFPVVLACFSASPSRAEFASFLDGCSLVLCRNEPFVVVVDGRDSTALPYELVVDAASWLEIEGERRRALCRGIALVLPGRVQRTVLGAIMGIAAIGPHAVFDDVPLAVSWALRVLQSPHSS